MTMMRTVPGADPSAPPPDSAHPSRRPKPAAERRSWTVIVPVLLLGLAGVAASSRLELGGLSDPGPGLWPLAVSVLLCLIGLRVLARGSAAETEAMTRHAAGRITIAIASLVAFTALFPVLGMTLPAIALLMFWMVVLGGVSWRRGALVSVVAALVLHLVFVELLAVPLPLDALFLYQR